MAKEESSSSPWRRVDSSGRGVASALGGIAMACSGSVLGAGCRVRGVDPLACVGSCSTSESVEGGCVCQPQERTGPDPLTRLAPVVRNACKHSCACACAWAERAAGDERSRRDATRLADLDSDLSHSVHTHGVLPRFSLLSAYARIDKPVADLAALSLSLSDRPTLAITLLWNHAATAKQITRSKEEATTTMHSGLLPPPSLLLTSPPLAVSPPLELSYQSPPPALEHRSTDQPTRTPHPTVPRSQQLCPGEREEKQNPISSFGSAGPRPGARVSLGPPTDLDCSVPSSPPRRGHCVGCYRPVDQNAADASRLFLLLVERRRRTQHDAHL